MNLVSFMNHLLTENGEEEKSLSRQQPLRESAEQLRLSLCAARAGSRRSGGLGLGLALANELVKLHGGTIDVESPGEGQGATFTIRLPYPSKSIAEESSVEAHWLRLKLSKSLQAAGY